MTWFVLMLAPLLCLSYGLAHHDAFLVVMGIVLAFLAGPAARRLQA